MPEDTQPESSEATEAPEAPYIPFPDFPDWSGTDVETSLWARVSDEQRDRTPERRRARSGVRN